MKVAKIYRELKSFIKIFLVFNILLYYFIICTLRFIFLNHLKLKYMMLLCPLILLCIVSKNKNVLLYDHGRAIKFKTFNSGTITLCNYLADLFSL